MKYVAITYHGKYVIVNRIQLPAGPAMNGLFLAGTGVGNDTIFERVELGDNRVALRTLDGLHVTAGPAGLIAEGVPIGPAQTFLEVWLPDDRIALRTHLETFVCAESDGDGLLVTNRTAIGEWEKFYYEQPPAELLPQQPPAVPHTLGKRKRRLRDWLVRPFR